MDLHLTAAQPTAEEKAAVDAELGAPESGWEGGFAPDRSGGPRPRPGGHEALLSPPSAAAPCCMRFRRALAGSVLGRSTMRPVRLDVALSAVRIHGVASLLRGILAAPSAFCGGARLRRHRLPRPRRRRALRRAEEQLGPEGSPCPRLAARLGFAARVSVCASARPAAAPRSARRAGNAAGSRTRSGGAEVLEALVRDAVDGRSCLPGPVFCTLSRLPGRARPSFAYSVAWGRWIRRASTTIGGSMDTKPCSRRRFGTREHDVRESHRSRGSSVAAALCFSRAGKKWEALHAQRYLGRTHHVICNADESEPGTFKDRIVMEGDPFAILEGADHRRPGRGVRKRATSTFAANIR